MSDSPTVHQVTPLSRPDCVASVLAGFARQRVHKHLTLAINGPLAAEVWAALPRELPDDVTPILTRPGKPAALNTALAGLRGCLVAVRDDDDVQLAGDLAECVRAMADTGAEIVSRHKHWVWDTSEDKLWLLGEHLAQQWGDHRLSGGSLLFHCDLNTPEFPDQRVGESVEWAKRMCQAGARVWRPSVNHQVFIRGRSDHLFDGGPSLGVCPRLIGEARVRAVYGRAHKARCYGKPTPEHQAMCRGEIPWLAIAHTIEPLR